MVAGGNQRVSLRWVSQSRDFRGSLRESLSGRLSSWDPENCYLTLALKARLGDLGCIGDVWEGDRQTVRLSGGSAVPWARVLFCWWGSAPKEGQGRWAAGENRRPPLKGCEKP